MYPVLLPWTHRLCERIPQVPIYHIADGKCRNLTCLFLVRLHLFIKHLAISLNHKRNSSKFSYINFPSRMQYSPRNTFVMTPRFTIPSSYSMNIYNGISGFRNAASASHISATHPSSSWYKVIPIRIIVDVSIVNNEKKYV